MIDRIYTAQDGEQMNQAEAQLRANGLNDSEERIVGVIDAFYTANRGVPVTEAGIIKLIEATPGLQWASQAELEYRKIAAENPAAAAQLGTWFVNQKQLAQTGDEGFQNASSILQELRGRAVTQETIQAAIASIAAPVTRFHAARRQLHFVQTQRRTEPVSRAAKDSPGTDSTNWLGDMVKTPDGSYRSKTVHEQRKDREAAEAANAQPQTSTLDQSEASWKAMADTLLQDGTHSQQARVRAVYDREQGNGWRRIYEMCKKEAGLYRNARSIR